MVEASEKELLAFWKKHVDGKRLYRVVARKYVPDIRRSGLNPGKNPYKSRTKDIRAFCRILLALRKKGFVMMRWWGRPVDQLNVVETTLRDITSGYIDFTPDYKSSLTIDYYLNLRGGALAQTIYIYSEELLMKQPPLTAKEWTLVKRMNSWSKELCSDENALLSIPASSAYLEHASFQHFTGPYVESPFGSFGHFKMVVKKNGLGFYKPYLEGKKLFYLRTTKSIPPSVLRFGK
ncbi:TPA: hypothetical protein HA251_02945 [Candidatus Woesearchaeota archaeon]|nr:hypothetical protein [Candidatus Woesearchaeota archaeon]